MSFSKQQLVKNSVWTLLELSVYPVLMIVAAPVFIKQLGIEQYGLWMLITNITLGINVLNIGVGDTSIRLISRYRAQDNFSGIKKVLHHNLSLSVFLCLCGALVGFAFYGTGFISLFYKSSDYHYANTLLLLACCSAGIKFIEICTLSVFKAFERFDINSKLMLLSKNSVMITSLVLVMLGYGLATVFIITLLINAVNVFMQLFVLHVFNRQLLSFPSLVFFRERLDVLNYNFWYWLQSVIGLLGFLADKLIVAYFTDVKTLGYYSIASLIGTQIHNFFMAFGSFIFPRVSFKLANNSGITPMYYVTRSFVALTGWLITLFLILSGDFIFKAWLGEETFQQSIFFIKLYLVFISGMLLNIIPLYFINGSAQIKLNSLFEVALRGTHFVLMITGYYLYGVNGILYGLILSTFINIPFQYFFFHRTVIPEAGTLQYMLVMLPVACLLGLVTFENVFFKLSLVGAFIALCKFIYFDTARQYTTGLFASGSFFTRHESK